MPWRETCVDDEKLRLVAAYLEGDVGMSELCARHGVSRQTGYTLVRRYLAEGVEGLAARSRAPHRHGQAMDAAVAAAIVALRGERPSWGPKKLKAVLGREQPEIAWPAASTIGDLLRREGLASRRRRRRSALPLSRPFGPVAAPNDLWCIDFKGWFRTRDGERCDPLTISDADSRYLLACRIVPPTLAGVQPAVDRVLRAYGLPRAIRSDNGAPFGSSGAAGLSRLGVHWLKLGIRLEFIDPGEPQQNGRHERMHGTLKKETVLPPAATMAAQQARFDRFRREFNRERPHEALGQTTPRSRYRLSPRPYPDRIERPWYDADHAERTVRTSGEIKWGGDYVFIGEALAGEPVGVAETASGDWIVRFMHVDLGLIDRRTKKLRRFAPPRPGRRQAAPTGKTVNHLSGP
jgi:putative transposase